MFKYIIVILILIYAVPLKAEVKTVGAGGDFNSISEATITAGDTLLVLNQTFSSGTQYLENISGTATKPIVIIAETEHEAIFRGGTEAIHLINCNYIELNGFVFEQQEGNGVNIDDGGDYNSPARYVTIRNCIFRDITNSGNHDFLKMSGVDDFLIENCSFKSGTGGSGIDFVGCHDGIVQDCIIDAAGVSGIQAKGGSQNITIRRNILKNMSQRAINLGGSTGFAYFRPPLSDNSVDAFEAADIHVYANIFIGNLAPIAYVGCVRVKVINNTFYKPTKWVIRILQETTDSRFLKCSENEFSNNIVYLESDLTEVNIGGETEPSTFVFTNNLWFNELTDSWTPNLPVTDPKQLIDNPRFYDSENGNFEIQTNSPAIGAGKTYSEPKTDFANVSFANPPSIGAYEGNPPSGISDIPASQNNVRIYPNPLSNNEVLNISFHTEKSNQAIKCTISDITGKILDEYFDNIFGTQAQVRSQLDERFSAGTYFIVIEADGKIIAREKFIVE